MYFYEQIGTGAHPAIKATQGTVPTVISFQNVLVDLNTLNRLIEDYTMTISSRIRNTIKLIPQLGKKELWVLNEINLNEIFKDLNYVIIIIKSNNIKIFI